jgi:hypothetical protein
MTTARTRAGVAAALVLAITGCGSGSDDTQGGEAERVLGEIKSLKEGEILVRGTTAPRGIDRSMPSTARVSPKCLVSPAISIAGSIDSSTSHPSVSSRSAATVDPQVRLRSSPSSGAPDPGGRGSSILGGPTADPDRRAWMDVRDDPDSSV